MKIIFYSLLVLVGTLSLQAHAGPPGGGGSGGYDHGNGGDMCENQFKSVREMLSNWIVKGGSKDLRLPAGISHEKYRFEMLKKMQTAKVSCIENKLMVGSAEKTCKNFVAADGSLNILCNSDRFMATSNYEQYILVHHEYAGLAGFEVNNKEDSNYEISNQIINGLVGIRITMVKLTLEFIAKIAVLPEDTPKVHSLKNNTICMYIGRMNQGDTTQELYRQLVLLSGKNSAFSKLKLNLMSLSNYCTEGMAKEDPNPISFEDVPALMARVKEIQQQLADIEKYLEQRLPK